MDEIILLTRLITSYYLKGRIQNSVTTALTDILAS